MSVLDIPSTMFKAVSSLPRRVFGTRNDRLLKRYSRVAEATEALEPTIRALVSEGEAYDSALAERLATREQPDRDEAEQVAEYEAWLQQQRVELSTPLRDRAAAIRERLANGAGEEDELPEVFAIVREASRRAQAHRHFECQLVGGNILFDGMVAEMKTGEGKTIVCHLACFLKVLQGENIHIVTVNDYLVRRDSDFAVPIFELLGISVGHIQSQVDPGGHEGIRHKAYAADITYGTASEFGFDYLRDNMKTRLSDQVQGRLDFVIIDEVDSILIDEARTPLIISGPARDDVTRYPRANKVAEELVRRQAPWDRKVRRTVERYEGDAQGIQKLDDAMRILGYRDAGKTGRRAEADADGGDEDGGQVTALGPDFLTDDQVDAIQIYENNVLHIAPAEQYRRYFIIQTERKQAGITHDGVTIAQELLDIGSLYAGDNMEWPHLIENAIRAHKVYVRDKDYVVQGGEVIIVDPFTGRLMHGRQWSDGLHQAIEAKERVTVKQETQTLATITIQNFFKLYKHRAGMTGTAQTEATEFMKIYNLDVAEVPTNRPINRVDHNDKMYRDTERKYEAIVDEIHEVRRRGRPADPFLMADVLTALKPILAGLGEDTSKIDEALRQFNSAEIGDTKVICFMLEVYDESLGDLVHGRPVLVGTTSVENSEKISRQLERRYGIDHEVLNAKQHAREAEIVAKAGHLTVQKRGRDRILLGNVTIATNMAGRGTDIKLGEGVVYATCKVPDVLPEGARHNDLYPVGITRCCIRCTDYDAATNCAHCFKPKLDPRFPALGRKVCTLNVPCGLHIIATERHEARRIDNQLRGRAGRQGDPGSSRFSLSLEDELLKLFMPDWMLKMMDKLGFSDGASLEDKRLTKGIERAQKKVEERNYSTRKHLIEWDEPMDFQRKEFYQARQRILEERDLPGLVFDTIETSIDSALSDFLDSGYRRDCVAKWCQANLDVNIEADRIDLDDFESAERSIRTRAIDELHDQIRTSVGEYIDPEVPSKEWDVGGLLQWASRAFKFGATQNQLRKMEPGDIEDALFEAAQEHYDGVSLEGITPYLDPQYAHTALLEWARGKFDIALEAGELADMSATEMSALILERVKEAYARREVSYPVEMCFTRAFSDGRTEGAEAVTLVVQWVNSKYRAGWEVADVRERSVEQVRQSMLDLAEEYLRGGRLDAEIREAMAGKSKDEQITWAKQRFGPAWNVRRFDAFDGDAVDAFCEQGREMLRWELTKLEQYILLRIYDQGWKDHLLEMDHLKHSIMQRPLGGDQTHPQSQYAIEGRGLFDQMWSRIAGRVTDIVFKVQSAGGTGQQGGGAPVSMTHADATGAGFAGADADRQAAMRAQGAEQKVKTIRREKPKVGRNDPCPCGSGKKYKACHGRQ